jgi:glycosyltransferase involved in cell wall biosynthesis
MSGVQARLLVHTGAGTDPPEVTTILRRTSDAFRRAGITPHVVGEMASDEAVRWIEGEHARAPFDAVVAADRALLAALAANVSFTGRLWPLMLTLPAPLQLATGTGLDSFGLVATASKFILCPDELTRGMLDATVPGAAHRTVVVSLGDSADGEDAADSLGEALVALLRRAMPSVPALAARGRALRIVVAGHALHFLASVVDFLGSLPEVDLRIDHVRSFARQDEQRSLDNAQWADVVICEWCSPVAIWYSHHKRPGQRLIVRLHRYELYKGWPAELDIDAVDQVICVSRHYAGLTLQETGWPAGKVAVIPNVVDVDSFDRPKLPGSDFHLGFLGMVPKRKRVDLALDVLEQLRRRDDRFTLFVKTKMPWDDAWNRSNPEEQAYAEEIFGRIQRSSVLREGFAFDPYGPDVAAWMRKIGFVLSTSDDESFHLAPAEAMSSGAVPALLAWPGASTIYDECWIHADVAAMADAIWDAVASGRRAALGTLAQRQARASFDIGIVNDRFVHLLQANLPPAPATPPRASWPEHTDWSLR